MYMKTKLTEQNYWIDVQGKVNLKLANDNLIKLWIEDNLDLSKIKNCIEIGCFPGRFLTIFGDHGVEVNGLDFIPEVDQLKNVFEQNGYAAGDFINADFTNYLPQRKYECIASFGFIEHFTNWDFILKKHFDYIDKDGYLIVEVPNFRGFFQRIIRVLFDNENYKRHNIQAMNLEKWKKVLLENNFEIIDARYFGGYQLWYESKNKSKIYFKLRNLLSRILNKIIITVFEKGEESKHFSCVLGIIAKKK
jgi:SAM-dependent methyltransferase